MLTSIYLHRPVAETLLLFGDTLEDSINRILDVCAEGRIDLMDKPACPDRTGAMRYNIDIKNAYYLDLYNYYPVNSSKISLRRLLYWFVDNEIYNELGWRAERKLDQRDLKRDINNLSRADSILAKVMLKHKADTYIEETISTIHDLINNIQEYLEDE